MKSIRAIIQKEIRHILRDRRTLMMIIMMPLIQLAIYGYAINTDVKHMAAALYDEDRTPLSRRLIQSFEQSAYFDVKYRVGSQEELRKLLDKGKVKAAFHIPPNFAKDLLAQRGAKLQLLIDGTDSSPANTEIGRAHV